MQDQGRVAPIRVVGRYALFDEIAVGGMATVHLGRLLASVGFARTVAIKRIHAHLAEDSKLVAMFINEARLASRLRHPNVVAPVDVVSSEHEVLLVMEYVHGESLSRLIREAGKRGEQIPVEIVAPVMAGVLHGLHSAHEALDEEGRPLGIVHRDVSPQNVIVGVDGVSRVVDFGIAKAVGRLQRTQPGELKGKLAYMSPEQIRAEPLDRRTDVYACGVVLWEALTGRRMFAGESDAAVLPKILIEPIPAPSTLAPGVSALDDLVLRCLDRDAGARFATARDVARALEQAVRFAPASAIGEWVEALAGQALHERAATISSIERASADLMSTLPATGTRAALADAPDSQLITRVGFGALPVAAETLDALDGAATLRVDAVPASVSEVATPIMRGRSAGAGRPLAPQSGGTRALHGSGRWAGQ